MTSVVIDGNNNQCGEQNEITSAIRIHDGRIIESECIGSFTYIIFNCVYFSMPGPNFTESVVEVETVQIVNYVSSNGASATHISKRTFRTDITYYSLTYLLFFLTDFFDDHIAR